MGGEGTDATGGIRQGERILINERAFANSRARSARKNAPICPRSEREMKLRQTRIWSVAAAAAVARARNLGETQSSDETLAGTTNDSYRCELISRLKDLCRLV